MGLHLQELQEQDEFAWKTRTEEIRDGWENVKGVFWYQSLLYVPEIIRSEVISCHHNNLLEKHFGIDKTQELVARKYYWPNLRLNIKTYIRECDICLASKAVCHKLYGDLQLLSVPIHCWKDFSIYFVMGLPSSTNWKRQSYDSILVIVDRLTKMVHYELVKITIDALGLAEVILNIVVWHHGFLDSIVSDRDSLFTSKFWSSLYYFLGIKQRLSTAFYPQTDD